MLAEYDQGWKVTDIFPVNSVGIVTARDDLTIHWDKQDVLKTIHDFASLPTKIARTKYALGKDSRDWQVKLAQADLKDCLYDEYTPNRGMVTEILYRPFDNRYTYYTGKTKGFHCMPRNEVMQHMILGTNLSLIFMRQVAMQENYSHFMVTNNIVDNRAFYSNKGIMPQAPLYLCFHTNNSQKSLLSEQHSVNLSQEFLNAISEKLGYTPTPEAIFYYIYAIFHSPTYRTRYAEFLKIDFPRVPLTNNNELFRKLANYGEQLVQLHLMTSPKLDNLITEFVEATGNRTVDPGQPKYNNGAVIINKKGDKFTGVPEEVWNFYVGGYQPCQKWLKDRKGRTLSDEDILHYQKVVISLKETIELMAKIDEAIPGFPIE